MKIIAKYPRQGLMRHTLWLEVIVFFIQLPGSGLLLTTIDLNSTCPGRKSLLELNRLLPSYGNKSSKYEVWSKINVIFKFRKLRIFFCCVGTNVCYICWQYTAILGCQYTAILFLTDRKVCGVVTCSSIFFYLKKWIKRNCFKCWCKKFN